MTLSILWLLWAALGCSRDYHWWLWLVQPQALSWVRYIIFYLSFNYWDLFFHPFSSLKSKRYPQLSVLLSLNELNFPINMRLHIFLVIPFKNPALWNPWMICNVIVERKYIDIASAEEFVRWAVARKWDVTQCDIDSWPHHQHHQNNHLYIIIIIIFTIIYRSSSSCIVSRKWDVTSCDIHSQFFCNPAT